MITSLVLVDEQEVFARTREFVGHHRFHSLKMRKETMKQQNRGTE